MKLCILMCGLKRTYEEVKASLHNNLINVLLSQNAEIDSFVHSDKPIEIFNLRATITSIPKNNENIPIQMSRFNECYTDIVLPYMNKHKIKYDFFICLRPDNFYFKNCLGKKISEWNTNKINIRMRIYPTNLNLIYQTGYLTKGVETVDDQFFIIPKIIANIAFSIKKGQYPILCENDWNEGKLTKLWNSNNLKFQIFPINSMIYYRILAILDTRCQNIYKNRKRIESGTL